MYKTISITTFQLSLQPSMSPLLDHLTGFSCLARYQSSPQSQSCPWSYCHQLTVGHPAYHQYSCLCDCRSDHRFYADRANTLCWTL